MLGYTSWFAIPYLENHVQKKSVQSRQLQFISRMQWNIILTATSHATERHDFIHTPAQTS